MPFYLALFLLGLHCAHFSQEQTALSPVFESDQLYVRYHDQLTLVPLNFEPGEQDKTLWALSQAIAADYEIRYIKVSKGGDTLAFMRLTDYTILQRIQASSVNP